MKRYLPFAIIAGVLIIALAGGFFFYRSSQQPKSPTETFTQSSPPATPAAQQPGQSAPTPVVQQAPADYANAHARGGTNARATLEEYGDYQCPPCGALFYELKTIEKEYGNDMRFVFRHFPLSSHKHAFTAAHAAEAAGLQGKFWEMHDMIYQNQMSWSPVDDARTVFLQYARDLKLDVDRFTRDMESAEVAARVRADSQRGSSLRVEGTPTIFINGRQLRPEAMTPDGLRMALDYVLGKKR